MEAASDRWQFSESAADMAYQAAMDAAHAAATSEKSFQQQRRTLAKAVYNFIVTIIPLEELELLKRSMGDDTSKRIVLPPNIVGYLQAKGLPTPHLGASNPFLGIFHRFYQRARTEQQLISADEAQEIVNAANQGVIRNSPHNNMAHHYALLVLAAIDMKDPTLLDKGIRAVTQAYMAFRRTHPTLAVPARLARAKGDMDSRANYRASQRAAEASVSGMSGGTYDSVFGDMLSGKVSLMPDDEEDADDDTPNHPVRALRVTQPPGEELLDSPPPSTQQIRRWPAEAEGPCVTSVEPGDGGESRVAREPERRLESEPDPDPIAGLQHERDNHAAQVQAATQQLRNERAKCEELEAQITALHEQLAEKDAEIATLREQLEAAELKTPYVTPLHEHERMARIAEQIDRQNLHQLDGSFDNYWLEDNAPDDPLPPDDPWEQPGSGANIGAEPHMQQPLPAVPQARIAAFFAVADLAASVGDLTPQTERVLAWLRQFLVEQPERANLLFASRDTALGILDEGERIMLAQTPSPPQPEPQLEDNSWADLDPVRAVLLKNEVLTNSLFPDLNNKLSVEEEELGIKRRGVALKTYDLAARRLRIVAVRVAQLTGSTDKSAWLAATPKKWFVQHLSKTIGQVIWLAEKPIRTLDPNE